MPLELITITGADDHTDINEMVDLSAQWPQLEWGILVAAGHGGDPRWPSHSWQEELVQKAPPQMNISMHICGRWVRELLTGKWSLNSIVAPISVRAERAQINTHAEPHVSTVGMLEVLGIYSYRWIFQLDGVNDHLLAAAEYLGLSVAGLYDTSHGAGVCPKEWPKWSDKPEWQDSTYKGYAGGLGPDNVAAELLRINVAAHDRQFWIDMQRNVRTEDDSRLDMDKVRRVLQITSVS